MNMITMINHQKNFPSAPSPFPLRQTSSPDYYCTTAVTNSRKIVNYYKAPNKVSFYPYFSLRKAVHFLIAIFEPQFLGSLTTPHLISASDT